MKTTLKLSFAAIIAVSIFLSSCGKYDDGPKISLASKTSRITRSWQKESCSNCSVTEYKKDGTIFVDGSSWSGTKWEFSSDKKNLVITSTVLTITTTSTAEILRLTSKELWVKSTYGSVTTETHYIAK